MKIKSHATHQLNNSNSKMAYPFGKSKRFPSYKLLTHTIYDVQDAPKRKNGGSFGTGKRTSLACNKDVPSPQTYILPSSLKIKQKRFHSGRHDSTFASFLIKSLKEKDMPGPNSYYLSSTLKEMKKTFGERLPSEIDLLDKKIISPGPDHYHLSHDTMNPEGRYASSKIKNVRKVLLLGREPSFDHSCPDLGPGTYNIASQSMDSKTRMKTSTTTFGLSKRPSPALKHKKYIPGPGAYETFSEFVNEQEE